MRLGDPDAAVSHWQAARSELHPGHLPEMPV